MTGPALGHALVQHFSDFNMYTDQLGINWGSCNNTDSDLVGLGGAWVESAVLIRSQGMLLLLPV